MPPAPVVLPSLWIFADVRAGVAMIAAENRAAGYGRLLTSETGGDQALLEVLNYEAEQARTKYEDDVHQLAGKMHVSEYTLGASVLGCGIALAVPTP